MKAMPNVNVIIGVCDFRRNWESNSRGVRHFEHGSLPAGFQKFLKDSEVAMEKDGSNGEVSAAGGVRQV